MSRNLLLFIFLLPLCAHAGGSVIYADDIAPLVAQRPELARRLEGLRLSPNGEGVRIGFRACPALAGRRIGPYEFHAVDGSGRSVRVTFETHDLFRDAGGLVVAEFLGGEAVGGDDISAAVSVSEELADIRLE